MKSIAFWEWMCERVANDMLPFHIMLPRGTWILWAAAWLVLLTAAATWRIESRCRG